MALTRKPTPAEHQAAVAAGTPSPETAAGRIRTMFCRDLSASLVAAQKLRGAVARHGKPAIVTALGADGAELDTAYAALKTYIQTLDPTADVPDL